MNTSSQRQLRTALVLFLVLAGAASARVHAQVSLTLGDTSLNPGDTGSITASIATDGSAVALQFDVLYDPAVLSLGTVNGGPALTGSHSIASNPISPGRDRVVITTAPVTALGAGVLATINLAVLGSAATGTTSLSWSGVVISNASAQPITPASLTPGSVTVLGGVAPPPPPPPPVTPPTTPPPEPEAIPALPIWGLGALITLMLSAAGLWGRRSLRALLPLAVALLALTPDSPQAQTLPGDANGDGRVDAEDVRLIVERILERGVLPGDGDCNRDSTINVLDTVCSQIPFVPGETAPIILGPGDRSIPADIAFEMNLFAADPDAGSTQSWTLLSGPAGLAVSPAGVLTWTPPASAAGANPVSIRVTDNTARTDEASFSIDVTVLPAAPAANAPPQLTVPTDQALRVGTPIAAQASATDPDAGDTLTYTLVDGPVGMTINSSTGALSWTPQGTQTGRADVVIRVEDAAGASDFGSFIVEATPLNAGPTAVDDVYIARKGETLVIPAPEGVMQNDTDPNDDRLSATRLSDPTLGTVGSFNADGSFEYTVDEPGGITIGLELKCETDISVLQTHAGTASAADVDGDGDVELVGFSVTTLGAGIFIVDPTDCSAVNNPIPAASGQPSATSLATLVNLDDDPELEVVTAYSRFGVIPNTNPSNSDLRLMAFNLDGSGVDAWLDDIDPSSRGPGLSARPSFNTGFSSEYVNTSPVAVDLNGDGTPELLAGYTQVGPAGLPEGTCRAVRQNTTCNAVVAWDGRTGEIIWEFIGGVTYPSQRSMSPTIVDLDMDGDTEIIWNQLVLDHEGNLVFELPVDRTISVANFELYGNAMFTPAIGNFDNDAFPEIVGYDTEAFYLFSHDGSEQWRQPWNTAGDLFGARADLVLAELDGDPFPELVTMIESDGFGVLTLRAFDSDGEPLWSQPQFNSASFNAMHSSSPVAIDLDRDGIDELIQMKGPTAGTGSDDVGLYIIDGATGDVIWIAKDPVASQLSLIDEPLTVADIDGDGSVEIVTQFNREFGFDRLSIFDNLPGEPFPPGRPIRSQTNVQPTWVNVDGSLPTSLAPHWLLPGRNYWNRIVPDLDPLAPEQDSFTYRVSDGEFDSAAATVNIEVRPNGNPPFILSEPDDATSAGIPYAYQPLVVDVDPGDSFTFELLNGPAGMTIDTFTGAVDWYPDSNGDFPVSIAVTDTLGLSAAQIFTLTVGDPVVVPDLVGQTEANAESALTGAGLLLGSRFQRSSATVPAGQVLLQNPPAGAVADLGSSVRVTLSSGPTPADTDGDGDGFTPNEGDCNDGDNTIYPAAPEIDGDGIDQSCNGIDGNKTLASIEVTPTNKRLLAGEPQPLKAMGIFTDGTAQDLTSVVAWTGGPTFFSAGAGSFTPEATLNGVTGSASFTVIDRVDEDAAPIARISAPGNGGEITAPTTVTGTALDANLLRWELAYQYAGEDDFVTFAENTNTRSDQPIAEFDPTTLLNGLYTIRLQVFDAGGNVSEDTTTVRVEGQMKIGNYDLQFNDLDVPVAGLPIKVVRSYSTTDKSGKDFGIGWRLGLDTLRLGRNRPIGTAWRVTRSGLSFTLLEDDIHTVAITLPDGRVESFDARVSPRVSPVVPFPALRQTVSFVARPGTYGALEAVGDNTVTILDPQPGPATLTAGVSGALYDPERYRYTAVNGTQVVIHREGGVESITDRNGNSLTITAGGISHSSGRSIAFSRDLAGRISAITDPDGNVQSYRYSADGDLIAHIDPRGNTSRYEYDAEHNLVRIIDAAGRNVLRNVYDAAGRVASITDSEGRMLTIVHDIAGREERITDADGALTRYAYDDRGNVVSETNALGNTTSYTYDADDNLTRETNALGETETRVYDDKGNLLSVTDPLGNTTTFTVDAFGNVLSETDPRGAVTRFNYDSDGNLVRSETADGHERIYTHSTSGEVVGFIDETGSTIGFEYNASGDQTARIDSRGNRVESRYDSSGRLVGKVDRRGNSTTIVVNAAGARTQISDPLGNTERFAYDLTGHLESVNDALGNEQRQLSNGLGQVLSVTDRSGGELQFDFDLRGNLASLRQPRGGETVNTFDVVGRRIRTEFPDGSEALFSYDAADRLVARTDRRGGVTTFEYDAAGRQTATTNPLGQRTEQSYDANGNVITTTDPLGNVTRHTYDNLNRKTLTEFPDGRQVAFSYTARGELATETDALNNVTSYSYDPNGNLIRVVDPLGAETRYVYDAEDNLVEQLDGNGHSTRFEYDANNRETRRTYPDGSSERTEYDAAGRVSARVRADGTRISFDRDAEGRVTRRSIPGSTASYTWDPSGSLLSAFSSENAIAYQRDIEGRITAIVLGDGRRIDYRRDAEGNVVERSVVPLPGALALVTQHTYDALNRIISTTDPDGGVTTYSYTPVGTLARVVYANGVVTDFTYDSSRRTTRIRVAEASSVLENFNYSYDAADNITAVTLLDGTRIDYAYDALRRLLRETHYDAGGGVTTDLSYSYDAVGNRTRVAGTEGTEDYRYDRADKLIARGSQRFSYDANGNLLLQNGPTGSQSYSYDALDRLQRIDGPAGTVAYRYDALDHRVGRDLGAERIDYLVEPAAANASGLSQVLAETDPDTGIVRATNVFDVRLLARATGGSRYFFHHDVSENVHFLTGATGVVTDGYAYDAFGANSASIGSTDNPYRFASERSDAATGLVHLRARDYRPSIGRFMERDSFAGEVSEPFSRHRYLYARNNPLSFADGTGRFSVASLMAAQTLSNIIVAIAPTVTTGVTTIILLNKFWEAGFNYREVGYLMMVGGGADLDLLPGRMTLSVGELGFAVFMAGNRLIEVGAFAIDAANKLTDAGFAVVGAAKGVAGAASFARSGGSVAQLGKAGSGLFFGITGLAKKAESAGSGIEALGKAVRGQSQGPDKETLKSKGELEAERNTAISETLRKLALDVFLETQ